MSAFVDRSDHPTIPALPAVLNPAQLGEHLRQVLPSQTEGLKEIQVRLLRHRVGKRCVVEITLVTCLFAGFAAFASGEGRGPAGHRIILVKQ